MSDRIAVVVPAFNASRFLGVTLDSLRNQTLPPTEVVVVDDGSTDDTVAIARRMGAKVVSQAQRGPGAARNRGIAETSATWIAFCDADDWFAPNKLERQFHTVKHLGAQCISTDAWLVEADKVVRCKNSKKVVPAAVTMEAMLRSNPVICSTVLARREAIDQAGMFDESPELVATEDYDLWLRMAFREPIAYLDEPLTFYRSHAGSLGSNARFLAGIDRIMEKVAAAHGDQSHYRQLMDQHRAKARLQVAWDLLCAGQRQDCRAMVAEARGLTGWTGPVFRMWLRSYLGAGSRAAARGRATLPS
ncbi:MAG: hypothetical protein RL148_1509 [Planctomycetota bacterium]